METLDGQKIESIRHTFEDIVVTDDNRNEYHISNKELIAILSEFLFDVEQKKIRKHLYHIQPDVCLLYDQDKY